MERDALLAELSKAYTEVLRRLAIQLTRDEHDAGDLIQETLTRALAHLDQVRDPQRCRSWVVSIMHNTFLDRCRRERAEALRDAGPEVVHELAIPPEPEEAPPWADLTRDDLIDALRHLPAEFREVFELREFYQRSYQDISQRLGVPQKTARTRLHRARIKLRELLTRFRQSNEQAV
jgi:RNA polymerase sigma-70 factor (ECF subfamily)